MFFFFKVAVLGLFRHMRESLLFIFSSFQGSLSATVLKILTASQRLLILFQLMSADAFSAFEEVELSNRSALREVGRTCVSYETLLARYEGSVIFICYQCIIRALFLSSHGVFQDFRGRPSSSHALFKSDGFA